MTWGRATKARLGPGQGARPQVTGGALPAGSLEKGQRFFGGGAEAAAEGFLSLNFLVYEGRELRSISSGRWEAGLDVRALGSTAPDSEPALPKGPLSPRLLASRSQTVRGKNRLLAKSWLGAEAGPWHTSPCQETKPRRGHLARPPPPRGRAEGVDVPQGPHRPAAQARLPQGPPSLRPLWPPSRLVSLTGLVLEGDREEGNRRKPSVLPAQLPGRAWPARGPR